MLQLDILDIMESIGLTMFWEQNVPLRGQSNQTADKSVLDVLNAREVNLNR